MLLISLKQFVPTLLASLIANSIAGIKGKHLLSVYRPMKYVFLVLRSFEGTDGLEIS